MDEYSGRILGKVFVGDYGHLMLTFGQVIDKYMDDQSLVIQIGISKLYLIRY